MANAQLDESVMHAVLPLQPGSPLFNKVSGRDDNVCVVAQRPVVTLMIVPMAVCDECGLAAVVHQTRWLPLVELGVAAGPTETSIPYCGTRAYSH